MSSKLKKMLLAAGGLTSLLSMSAFAEGEAADAANTQVSGFAQYGTIIWLIIIVAVFYFMILRPQKKKEKADRMLRNSLQAIRSSPSAALWAGSSASRTMRSPLRPAPPKTA